MCTNTGLLPRLEQPQPGLGAAEEEFSARLIAMANHATLGLMVSIAHRTGLFEAMKTGPMTSVELARKAGLAERYVREWLGAMASGRIVELDPATRRYSLPKAHAAFLGRDAANGNMAAMFQFVSVLGGVESRIVDCFRTGGGVPYQAFERFHEVMAEESAQTVVAALDEAIIPLVPELKAQ